ncbi:MAG: nitrilase-related carbon-nitrogen hydrolase [Acidimicrobiales bacterium]
MQHDIAWEDPETNRAHLARSIEQAATGGADLVVLTEMFATGFSMATDRIAEPPDGPTAIWLGEQAAANGVWAAGSISTAVPGDDLAVNRLVVAGPAGELHHYDKIHPFSYGGEDEHYRGGTEHVVIEIDGVRTALFVCYDLRFADEFWTLGPDANLYLVPANWPAKRRAHWRALLVARAIENQAYVVGVNRVGHGGGIDYAGDSLIIDPLGEVLADGEGGAEQILTADIDLEHQQSVRERFPFLQDRR